MDLCNCEVTNEEIANSPCDRPTQWIPNQYATAFVLFQQAGDTFEPMEGLQKGTIYPELYFPYDKKRRFE